MKKRVLSLLVAFLLLIPLFSVATAAETDVVMVSDAEGFLAIANDLSGSYMLTSDIDLSGIAFTNASAASVFGDFYGTLDGNGFAVKNLTFTYSESSAFINKSVGLFLSNNGTIKNLTLDNFSFDYKLTSSADLLVTYAGAFCAQNFGEILSCVAVNLTYKVFVHSVSKAPYAVASNSIYLGGICGNNMKSVISCKTSGSINADAIANYSDATNEAVAGGITGIDTDVKYSVGSVIEKCFSNASVYASYTSGGICGVANYSTISSCCFSGTSRSDYYAGGITGTLSYRSIITKCFNTGDVYAAKTAGGMAALCATSSVVACSNNGDIFCESEAPVAKLFVGGICGIAYTSIIEDCANSGKIEVNAPGITSYVYAGGIGGSVQKVLEYDNYVKNCFNSGEIISTSTKINYAGAIAGRNSASLVEKSYYIDTSSSKAVGSGAASAAALTETQAKDKASFASFDFENIWSISDDYPVLQRKLSDYISVTLSGKAQYGSVLAAAVTGEVYGASLVYKWQRNGVKVGKNSPTYTLYSADVGFEITLSVTAAGYEGAVVTLPVVPTNVQQDAPDLPKLLSTTADSITVTAVYGREFSVDGINWQKSNVFTNLLQDTEYLVYARRAATTGYNASSASKALVVFTDKAEGEMTAEISGTAEYDNELSVNVTGAPEGADISVQWYVDGIAAGSPRASYTVYLAVFGKTISAVATVDGIPVSAGGRIARASTKTPPAAPVLVSNSTNSVEVATVAGCEYSIDGKIWQATGLFENLEPGKTFYVYTRRVAALPKYNASIARKLKVVTLLDTSDFTVTVTGSGEYATSLTADISGIDTDGKAVTYQWMRGNIPVGGNASSFICYYADIDKNIYVIVTVGDKVAVSNAIVGKKAPNNASSPAELLFKTESTITVKAVAGREYSIDGINWQSSNVFTDLTAETVYNVYLRRAESRAYFAGPASKALKVTTLVG